MAGEPDCMIQFAIGEQVGVRNDPAAAKLQLQVTVENDPQIRLSGFTRRETRVSPVVMMVLHWFL
jgi:hypothetical protein